MYHTHGKEMWSPSIAPFEWAPVRGAPSNMVQYIRCRANSNSGNIGHWFRSSIFVDHLYQATILRLR